MRRTPSGRRCGPSGVGTRRSGRATSRRRATSIWRQSNNMPGHDSKHSGRGSDRRRSRPRPKRTRSVGRSCPWPARPRRRRIGKGRRRSVREMSTSPRKRSSQQRRRMRRPGRASSRPRRPGNGGGPRRLGRGRCKPGSVFRKTSRRRWTGWRGRLPRKRPVHTSPPRRPTQRSRSVGRDGGGCPRTGGPGTGRGRAGTTRCGAEPRGRVADLGGKGLGACRPIGTRSRARLAETTLRRGHRSLRMGPTRLCRGRCRGRGCPG